MRNPKLIENCDALNILSLNHLALQTGIPKEEFLEISNNIINHYSIEEITQTKPDGRVKTRKIYHPSVQLKKILKAINKYLLVKIKLPDVVHGARKKHSVQTNAKVHIGKKYLLGFDIENFFPSIRPYNVFQMFKTLKCSSEVSNCLTRICTADNHVPQGYNTSPAVANLVLMTATKRLQGLSKKQGIKLGTFVDDIAISGNKDIRKYEKTIEKIINKCGYKLKSDKTAFMKTTQQQKVTGVIVNKKTNIDKKSFQQLKKAIHICNRYGHSALLGKISNKKGDIISSSERLKSYLSGRLNYVRQLNPEKAEKLMTKWKGIRW
jgi:RNA-directed DNA polymerase